MKDNIKEDMEYTTEDMEEINSLIEEIDMLCKDDSISPLREDQMCEFLLLKGAVREGKIEELRIQAEASKIPSKGLSPAQRRKMAIRMRIQAKKPGFIMKRLRSMKRAATKAVISIDISSFISFAVLFQSKIIINFFISFQAFINHL